MEGGRGKEREKRRGREEGGRRGRREEGKLPVLLVSSSSAVLPSVGAHIHCSTVLPWHWPVFWQEVQPLPPVPGNVALVSFARGRKEEKP